MAYYAGTFSCGHDGRVNIIGSSRDREWKRERAFNGICPECYKKHLAEQREEENRKSIQKSIDMDLPMLTGTEKQVLWATTLRLKVINSYEEQFEEFENRLKRAKEYLEKLEKEGTPSDKTLKDVKLFVLNNKNNKIYTSQEELSDSLDYAILTNINAKFWIDNRFNARTLADFIEQYREHKKEEDIPDDVKQEEIDLKQQLTVIPKSTNTRSGVVKIEDKNNVLCATYIKDEDFIKIVKKLNYKWNGSTWYKEITEYTGTFINCAAELGNNLLLSGYVVEFPDIASKDAAISSKFVPENDRWVMWNMLENRFGIVWRIRSDMLYEAAMKLPSACWKNGSINVKVEFYREVQDFAETMGFSISNKAKKGIEEYKQKECRFETANISVKSKETISDEARLEKSLKSSGTIIKDLIDE